MEISMQVWVIAGSVVAATLAVLVVVTRMYRLDSFDVLRPEETQATVALLMTLSEAKQHGEVYAALAPAVDRFHAQSEEDRLG